MAFFSRPIPEISVAALKQAMDQQQPPTLLDVRQASERTIANLGGIPIPLNELPYRVHELEAYKDQPLVVYCRSGGRSTQAVLFLREQGFTHVQNLKGGILAWSREIDPSVPQY